MSQDSANPVPELIEHLFRHQVGKILAALCRNLGIENMDIAEEAVQEAMLMALRNWPFQGVPDHPAAWLKRTAQHGAIDALRRRSLHRRKTTELERRLRLNDASGSNRDAEPDDARLNDDQLAMMFACCHPALGMEAQITLTLKAVCGFSVSEIARAFLSREETIAQRLVRAKRRIQEERIHLAIPPPERLPARLDTVLRVIYQVFNEGYAAHAGKELIRRDFCGDAIRLARQLVARQDTGVPQAHALLGLLLMQESRSAARVDSEGNLRRLRDQDRSLWDHGLICAGLRHLELAASGEDLTEFHVQAAIASVHAVAPSFETTDWSYALELYDQLMRIAPTPVAALNRVVVMGQLAGTEAALRELEPLRHEPSVREYYLTPAVHAELLTQLGRHEEAAASFRKAAALPCSEPERRFLQQQLDRSLALSIET